MLQAFLRTATDGWTIALSSVRDLLVEEDLHPDEVGGDFAGEAERLGEATASVHADLAPSCSTPSTSTPAQRRRSPARWACASTRRSTSCPSSPSTPRRCARATTLSRRSTTPMPVQRVHGDLHLGQTLRTVKGWKIIDFEGEPAKSLEPNASPSTRRCATSRGCCGRSTTPPARRCGSSAPASSSRYRADEWTQRNREAFLDGYSRAAGAADAERGSRCIRAYEADKAVYEAVYEARNRPSWLRDPAARHRTARRRGVT